MIAKISSTENLGGALGYNFKKVGKEEASILLAQGLYQNKEETYTMEEVFADMGALIPKKCRTKKTVFHCSLNPHPDEKLSDERLTQIAKEYMEALGYGNQPYIVFKHNDIAREHIHIVSLRIDGEGKKINDKFEKRRSKHQGGDKDGGTEELRCQDCHRSTQRNWFSFGKQQDEQARKREQAVAR